MEEVEQRFGAFARNRREVLSLFIGTRGQISPIRGREYR
jgi:hypothetical protein